MNYPAILRTSLLFIVPAVTLAASIISTQQALATKGKFFVHNLHSAQFFTQSVPVKWEATLKGKPALPLWLHLVRSSHPQMAYLIGTPVTENLQATVHVMAKDVNTFDVQQKYIIISMADDPRFNGNTVQTIELYVTNMEMENFLRNHNRAIEQFETGIWRTFRGKQVNPYIYAVRHEIEAPPGKEYINRNKFGFVVEIGTQRGFYQNTQSLVDNLRSNRTFCRDSRNVPINNNFSPNFNIDWCRIRINNHSLSEEKKRSSKEMDEKETKFVRRKGNVALTARQKQLPPPVRNTNLRDRGFSFWHSFLVFPLIAVFCILLILLLSIIFFGRREGQQWRDYKTPKEQLEEYVSVRESQRHLRELSQQRQMLLMNGERDRSLAPSGIHTFLQPKNRAPSQSSAARFSKSSSRVNEQPEDRIELLHPVGKQTVEEAARLCGSSLHLYRNPLESESEDESERFRQTD